MFIRALLLNINYLVLCSQRYKLCSSYDETSELKATNHAEKLCLAEVSFKSYWQIILLDAQTQC